VPGYDRTVPPGHFAMGSGRKSLNLTLGTDNDFDRPSGTGLSASLTRHLVPGYDQPVPSGQKPFAHRADLPKLPKLPPPAIASVSAKTSGSAFE
jgi:hypothetical protein